MMINYRFLIGPVAVALALSATTVRAQDDQPGAEEKPAAKAPANKAPAGNAGVTQGPETVFKAADPVAEALLLSKPQTPHDFVETAQSLIQIDRADLAKPLLQQLLASKPESGPLADLARQFGGALFVNLAENKQLQPEGAKLADAVLTAAYSRAHDPTQLAELIKRLADPSVNVQHEALVGLVEGGADAAAVLVGALADPAQEKSYPLIRSALVHIGQDATGPLVAASDSDNPAIARQAIEMLADIGDSRAVADLAARSVSTQADPRVRQAAQVAIRRLIGPAPTKAEAIQLLAHDAQEFFDGKRVMLRNGDGNVSVWQWDAATHLPRSTAYPPQRAGVFVALRLARQLHALMPDDPAYRRLYLVSLLESAVYRVGMDHPLPTGTGSEYAEAAQAGVDDINDALASALATGHTTAGIAAVQILAEIGSGKLLVGDGSGLAPLVAAVGSADPRLRFAAAQAVMKFKPTTPFAGSSLLTQMLVHFASAAGRSKVLVGFPTSETGQQLAGMLNSLGIEPVTVTNGEQLVSSAVDSADYQLLLISDHIGRPAAEELVQQLRRDPRTAWIPIGLMAEAGGLDLLRQWSEAVPLAFMLPRPAKPEEMKQALDDAARLAGDRIVPAKIREQHAVQALDWLAVLAEQPPQLFDVSRYQSQIERDLYIPALSQHAAEVMARLGTSFAQRSLVELASRATLSLEIRQAAAAAFSQSVRLHGVRLTADEVLRQYDRYNQAAHLDQATQQVLALVLDAIELPTKAKRSHGAAKSQSKG